MTARVEGRLERAELVHDAAKRPHVTLARVALATANFWAHVERCSNIGAGKVVCREKLGETKVAQLHCGAIGQEDILRLQISVQDNLVFILSTNSDDRLRLVEF